MTTGFLAKAIAAGILVISTSAFADYQCAVLAPTSPGADEYGQVLAQKSFADADLAKAQAIFQEGTTIYAALFDSGFLTVASINQSTGKANMIASGNGSEVILMDAVNTRAVVCQKASPEAPAPGSQSLRLSM